MKIPNVIHSLCLVNLVALETETQVQIGPLSVSSDIQWRAVNLSIGIVVVNYMDFVS